MTREEELKKLIGSGGGRRMPVGQWTGGSALFPCTS